MNWTTEKLTFTVPLSLEAHSLAQEYQTKQLKSHKGKQIYLNTLAMYAVDFYLQCLGFETSLKQSYSRNILMQKFMDVADLEVEQLGRLECRPVLPDAEVLEVPPDAWSDRIAYVAVQLNQSLKQAKLLGFAPTVVQKQGIIPVGELRSLEEFPVYLNQFAPPQLETNLSQWFEEIFEAGWQTVETVLGLNQRSIAFSSRNASHLLDEGVKRAKLIDWQMELGHQSVALLVALTKTGDRQVSILVQVHPVGAETYLPSSLKLALLSPKGETLREVQSRHLDNFIQLPRFHCQSGETFRLQVALNEHSLTEEFII